MNADSITYVLEALGSPRVKNAGKNVQAACPLAPWKHGSGEDPSMKLGVLVTDGMSPANCFYPDCHRGTLMGLVDEVAKFKIQSGEWQLGDDIVSELKSFILLAEEDDEVTYVTDQSTVQPVTNDVLSLVGSGSPYWSSRGLSDRAAGLFQVGEGRGRALLPLIDRQGQVVAVKGRLLPGVEMDEVPGTLPAREAKYRLWPPSFPSGNYLYGEHLLKNPVDLLIVVESETDAALLNDWLNDWFADPALVDSIFPYGQATSGFLAVATMGSKPTAEQMQKIVEFLSPQGVLVLGMDADNAGRLATRSLTDALMKRLPRIMEVEWERKDPSDDNGGEGEDGEVVRIPLAQVKDDAARSLARREDWFTKRMMAVLRRAG